MTHSVDEAVFLELSRPQQLTAAVPADPAFVQTAHAVRDAITQEMR